MLFTCIITWDAVLQEKEARHTMTWFAVLVMMASDMYSAFLAIAAGAPPMLATIALGMFSNLYMSTAHYSSRPAPILFGAGFLSLQNWWKIGFVFSLIVIPVFFFIGRA
ncbi:hypothetical protein A6E14_03585 [Vibrio genomosp. F10]|uniref:Citrate transporter-like domain-containing protein n=1 Tax=Vibrio genomosp. F10 TaxID=723171 RepID=A0A1B9QT31_9VIBR|nr:hypothetical protein A6E14_03585 [Vibrio genomosp. F10]